MKVKIGPYIRYWGPYQIADILQKVGVSEDTCYDIGAWLSKSETLNSLCQWIYSKRDRKVSIHIDRYDVWNMDHTLSMIIVPMLYQIRDDNHGTPNVSPEDVPEELRDTEEEIKAYYNDGTISNKYIPRWEYVLGEMIWAMEQVRDEKYDYVGVEEYKKYQERIQNGLRLFGVYFSALWT